MANGIKENAGLVGRIVVRCVAIGVSFYDILALRILGTDNEI
jgi:hypothetical protein